VGKTTGRSFARVLLAGALVVAIVAALLAFEPGLWQGTQRVLLFGRPLLELQTPRAEQIVPPGGVSVVVRFPASERIDADSFRCTLNGEDVTDRLTQARNGAAGTLMPQSEGENHLRVRVLGRSWWSDRYFEDAEEIRFRVRGLPSFDRAARPFAARLG
jgi:hypothetical protein